MRATWSRSALVTSGLVRSFPCLRINLLLKLHRSLLRTSRLLVATKLTSSLVVDVSPTDWLPQKPPLLQRLFTMPIWDPLVPAERVIQRGLAHLPPWISRWLGYRGTNLPPSRTWVVCLWGFIGAWGGVASIIAVFGHTHYFHNIHLVPPIVASFVSTDPISKVCRR